MDTKPGGTDQPVKPSALYATPILRHPPRCPENEVYQGLEKVLPFPHKFASAPATILRVCGSSVLEAVFASN